MAKELKDLTKRAVNYSQSLNDLVVQADLAEQSAVRGCMVIKPYGYAIWEKMQQQLDKMLKETGAQNAYFPLLIPKSFLSREAEHVEGSARTRYNAFRHPCEECGSREQGEGRTHQKSSHHLHAGSGTEGGAGQHGDSDYLLRPQR